MGWAYKKVLSRECVNEAGDWQSTAEGVKTEGWQGWVKRRREETTGLCMDGCVE